jgi:hypothetical protein
MVNTVQMLCIRAKSAAVRLYEPCAFWSRDITVGVSTQISTCILCDGLDDGEFFLLSRLFPKTSTLNLFSKP